LKINTRVEFVPIDIAREALLKYHIFYLDQSESSRYVEDALLDSIKEMVILLINKKRQRITFNISKVWRNVVG
jgi:hypothetical protein